jgi:hypothetical protein
MAGFDSKRPFSIWSYDGLAHEHWGFVDMMAMMQQLGVVPDAPPA